MSRLLALMLLAGFDTAFALTFAPADKVCGDYVGRGVVRYAAGELSLVLLEGSGSETRLKLQSARKELNLYQYYDTMAEVRGSLTKPIVAYRGALNVEDIKIVILDYANPHSDQTLKLLRKRKCTGKSVLVDQAEATTARTH